ncbi:AsmA family protein [Hoeflea prorocentri]|uniref:AsmA family protein n=1 Tax=Hoeflea prorocentri TaxID=1922333 RepID=A0A9X3ZHY6_9HYPH|nr:AsmA-like C-terminal region-containing protein [Hoeflea prorocentri]MCY6382347.1 AsmA family protein [Hoeflea prorocentri]MDA5400147.1 AsmA family protein [Hoeflea prorocentri]
MAIVVVAGIVAAVSGIALPFVISTDLVRDRLERDISDWTGHEFELLDNPQIGFWPVPRIELNRISVSSKQFPDAEPIVFADELKADFSIFSALRGRPSFSNFVLVRPVFTVEKFPEGITSWNSPSGRIAEGIDSAVAHADAGDDASKLPPIPAYRLGEVTVENGAFNWIDRTNGDSERITAINGTVSWPRLNGAARADVRGIYRGEAASLSVTSNQPLRLLAGRTANFTIDLKAAPLNVNFQGDANLSKNPFALGAVAVQSPSMRQALEWVGTEIKPGEAIGEMSLEADLQLQNDRAMLDKLIVELEGNQGIGILDIKRDEDTPGISGTLAFNSLDIASFLRAFTPLPRSGEDIAKTIDTSFLSQLKLDMRLSAQTATLGRISLTDVAAAARIDGGRATFDVGDATAYGGSVLGRVTVAESGVEGGGELRFSARDINLEQVLSALDIQGPFPQGTASMNAALSTPFPTWATGLSDLDGKLELSIINGSVPSFDTAQFRELAKTERFFGLGGISQGSFPFKTAEFQATFSNGLAEINKGDIVAEETSLSLTGIIPYQRGGLALIGILRDVNTEAAAETGDDGTQTETGDPVREETGIQFFVGGSWPTPVISPIISN